MTDKHHMVKWTEGNMAYFGLFRGKKAGKITARPGHVFVDDAIFPTLHEVPEGHLVDIVWDYKNMGNNEYEKFVEAQFQKASAISRKAGKSLKIGKLFSVSVGDGKAWYVVTNVGKKTASVEWRGFHPDRYFDCVLGCGGAFPIRVIDRLIGMEDCLEDIFSKPKPRKPRTTASTK